jgi:hypothetical protein
MQKSNSKRNDNSDEENKNGIYCFDDRLCGLVVTVSWLQIQRSEFDYRRHQIFWEVMGLESGPLSLVSTTEELFERKSSGRMDPPRWPRDTPISAKIGTNFADKLRSIDIVRSRPHATEFFFFFVFMTLLGCNSCTISHCKIYPQRKVSRYIQLSKAV